MPAQTLGVEQALLSMLLAFVLGQAIAWVYIYTHSGLSYSRSMVQSLVALTVILCLGMMVIGYSFAIAFGLIGALSVIRFRNILKDTRDTSFIFASLVVGMACGTAKFPLAALGAVTFCLVMLYLYWTNFGTRNTGDGFVRMQVASGDIARGPLQAVLDQHCLRTQLVSQRFEAGGDGEYAFRLSMRDTMRSADFVGDLQQVDGVSDVVFALQEDEAEV
jgi:hypothetical protein